MPEKQAEPTPEQHRDVLMQAIDHAAMAGAFAELHPKLRAHILAGQDWLRGLDLKPAAPAGARKGTRQKGAAARGKKGK